MKNSLKKIKILSLTATAKDSVKLYSTHLNTIISCFCLFFLSMNTLTATNYYVSTTGDDSNNGTSTSTAWQTIQKAASTAIAGDTVYIEAGDYGNENVTFLNNGTAANPIVFEGYQTTPGDNPTVDYTLGDSLSSNDMPLLDGGNRATAGTALYLNGHNYIILKNIQIQNYNIGVYGYSSEYCVIENIIAIELGDPIAEYDGKGIVVGTYGNNNLIKRCIVANACAEGISAYGNTNTIQDCKAYCDDDRSIEAAMDYYIVIKGDYNTITGCYVDRVGNLPHGGHGITLKTDCEYNLVKNCISVNQANCFCVRHRGVKYNTFENCIALGADEGGWRDTGGLMVRDGASYNTFKNCRTIGVSRATCFYDTAEDDGAQSAGSYNKFENCIFEDTTDNCISFFYYDQESSAFNNDFINCTFYGGDYLFECDRSNSGNTLVNCIVTGISYLKTGSYALNYSSAYSDFYNNGFATPAGTGNFSGDTLFVDAANGDFRLRASSTCINAGTSTGAPAIDYNYLDRPFASVYDVGAHEYCSDDPALVYIKLNENTGSDAADVMGSISDGTISGAGWTTGISGSALDFDGTNDSINFGDPAELNMTGSRSISAWIKPESNGTYNTIAAKYFWGWSLSTRNGKLYAYVKGSTTSAYSLSNENITVGQWQHVAMTFDVNGDKKIQMYINGEEVTYAAQIAMVGSPVTTTHDFSIGSDFGYRYWFNGIIDEVKIFNRVLDASEVFDEYSTVLRINMDNGTGSVVKDASMGNDGTTDGANWVEGISGRALDFNGINDYVNFGNPSILNLTGSRSISAWIKPESNGTYNVIAGKYIWGYSIFTSSGHLRSYISGSSSSANSLSDETVSIGEWSHVAMTFDIDGDKKIHLYINGAEVTYTTQTAMVGYPVNTTHDFSIGSDRGARYWFGGIIDEVKIYNQSLSQSEIEDIYQAY